MLCDSCKASKYKKKKFKLTISFLCESEGTDILLGTLKNVWQTT